MARVVERIGAEDVARAHAILAACGRAMGERGLPNWDPPYPLEAMRAECTSRQVYVVREEDLDVATFTLGPEPLRPYPTDVFDPSLRALYLNRLAVVPERWGGGLGRWCMADIDARARAAGAVVVRFDAFRDNPGLRDFYRRLHYIERGPFAIGKLPVICFEKVVVQP
ncbi:MAG: GCN5-related N-acetyltransferase [Myxococcales bacterium]|nr:GCN5-related N-acetyltransferase [Myxococcales bacterium]